MYATMSLMSSDFGRRISFNQTRLTPSCELLVEALQGALGAYRRLTKLEYLILNHATNY